MPSTGTRRGSLRLVGLTSLLLALATTGCDNTAGQPGGLTRGAGGGQETWTIRCARIITPDHHQEAQFLAGLLGKVQGLKAANIRVVDDAAGSTVYYGQYVKVSSSGGSLVFPVQYQKDIELIRSLAYRQQTPFFFAAPELATPATPSAGSAEGDVSTAKGTYSLLIAIFYNTPTFNERKETAEAYVKQLRKEGHAAYYYHEQLRSFVYVGDFDASDLVTRPDGQQVYGPRVEQLVARNPAEFKNQTENGHHMNRSVDGTMVSPPSILVPLPGRPPAQAAPRQPGSE